MWAALSFFSGSLGNRGSITSHCALVNPLNFTHCTIPFKRGMILPDENLNFH